MAGDNVVIYWVPLKGVIYGASLVSRTYVGISSLERLGAAKRALDYAGVPHKDWPHGEPNSMEEFGTEVRDASEMDWLFAQIKSDTSEARRMLGVLLGWSNGKDGSSEQVSLQSLQASLLQCVVSKDTGAWYAVGPQTFFWLKTADEANALRSAGVLSKNSWPLSDVTIKGIRESLQRPIEDMYVPKAVDTSKGPS
jgi:hypothetical protein